MARRKQGDPQPAPTNTGGGLSPGDRALWDAFTEQITPLDGRTPAEAPRLSPAGNAILRVNRTPDAAAEAASLAPTDIPASLDRRTHKAIARGKQAIDRRLDLHGETQASAYTKLRAALFSAYSRGERVVLVVTGKGGRRYSQRGDDGSSAFRTRSDFNLGGGVLRTALPVWLASAELAPLVSGFSAADATHGGDGAFYIRVRRRK